MLMYNTVVIYFDYTLIHTEGKTENRWRTRWNEQYDPDLPLELRIALLYIRAFPTSTLSITTKARPQHWELHALLFTTIVWFLLRIPTNHNIEGAGDGAYGSKSLSEKTWTANHFQIQLQGSGLGLEPSNSRTAVRRSTNWANQANDV